MVLFLFGGMVVESKLVLVHLVLEGGRRGFSGHLLVISVLPKSVLRLCGVWRWICPLGCSGHVLVISVLVEGGLRPCGAWQWIYLQ